MMKITVEYCLKFGNGKLTESQLSQKEKGHQNLWFLIFLEKSDKRNNDKITINLLHSSKTPLF